MNPTDFTDQALWFETEVQPHARALRSWLLVRFPTIPDVDDLVQDSFTRILKAKAKGPVGSSRALLFTIARNLALDAIRTPGLRAVRLGLRGREDETDIATRLARDVALPPGVMIERVANDSTLEEGIARFLAALNRAVETAAVTRAG